MKTRKHWRLISAYAAAHFLVDFACAILVFRFVAGTPDGHLCLLLYNFCAFAMQMPLGLLADRLNKNHLVAVTGCMLVGAAYGLWLFPLAAVVVAGIGNGSFHVGGGIDVLNVSTEKSGALGVFVSPGALGVYFGTALGNGSGTFTPPILLALLIAAGVILLLRRAQGGAWPRNAALSLEWNRGKKPPLAGGASFAKEAKESRVQPYPLSGKRVAPQGRVFFPIAAACLFGVVCLRSAMGLALNFPWKSVGGWGIVLVCAVALGKTAGGFAADRFGMVRTSCVSLGLAALLFLLPQTPAAGVLSVLLFNMTMPITLWAMAKLFPGAKGFSFGLLTFGLFLGYLPVYLGFSVPAELSWLFAAGAIASLALLHMGLRKARL